MEQLLALFTLPVCPPAIYYLCHAFSGVQIGHLAALRTLIFMLVVLTNQTVFSLQFIVYSTPIRLVSFKLDYKQLDLVSTESIGQGFSATPMDVVLPGR